MRLIFLLLAVALAGCVFPSDIERLEEGNQIYYDRVEKTVADLRGGKIDTIQSIAEIKAAQVAREAEYASTMRDIEARTETALKTVDGVASGSVGLGQGIAGLAVTALGLWFGRDYTRKKTLAKVA